jgi:hypothetical protein
MHPQPYWHGYLSKVLGHPARCAGPGSSGLSRSPVTTADARRMRTSASDPPVAVRPGASQQSQGRR